MTAAKASDETETRAWEVLAQVLDPEIPVLSVVDLGIVRAIESDGDGLDVSLSPTYSGCPATEVIEESVKAALTQAGLGPVRVKQVISPPWTTDWISAAGRDKLKAYGIVPPEPGQAAKSSSKLDIFGEKRTIRCPRCDSSRTSKTSEFGSTPCKASYKCADCLEPFEYFKCI